MKKLVLTKVTVSSLDDNSLSGIKGGVSAPVWSGPYNGCDHCQNTNDVCVTHACPTCNNCEDNPCTSEFGEICCSEVFGLCNCSCQC